MKAYKINPEHRMTSDEKIDLNLMIKKLNDAYDAYTDPDQLVRFLVIRFLETNDTITEDEGLAAIGEFIGEVRTGMLLCSMALSGELSIGVQDGELTFRNIDKDDK